MEPMYDFVSPFTITIQRYYKADSNIKTRTFQTHLDGVNITYQHKTSPFEHTNFLHFPADRDSISGLFS